MNLLSNANFMDRRVKYYELKKNDGFKITLYLKRSQETKELVGNFTSENLTEWTYRHTLPGLVLIDWEDPLNAIF